MIKHGNKVFYVLVTDNGLYLKKSDPSCLSPEVHEASMYDKLVVAKRCLTIANERFNWQGYNGLIGYHGTQARKLGVKSIHIAEITIHSYDEIII